MNLKLNFGEPEPRQLTSYEINEPAMAAQGVKAIVKVMDAYVNEKQDQESAEHCLQVFRVLQWLIEPIDDYPFAFAGEPAAKDPEKKLETAAQ